MSIRPYLIWRDHLARQDPPTCLLASFHRLRTRVEPIMPIWKLTTPPEDELRPWVGVCVPPVVGLVPLPVNVSCMISQKPVTITYRVTVAPDHTAEVPLDGRHVLEFSLWLDLDRISPLRTGAITLMAMSVMFSIAMTALVCPVPEFGPSRKKKLGKPAQAVQL